MCTVQAPHCAMPHPNFVPCKPTTARIAHKRGMSGSESSVMALPLSVKAIDMKDPHIGLDHLCGEIVVLVEARRGRRARHTSSRAAFSVTWGWHQLIASHSKVRFCYAGTRRAAARGHDQRICAAPSFFLTLSTNRSNAASLARGSGVTPNTGFGQSGSVFRRATI